MRSMALAACLLAVGCARATREGNDDLTMVGGGGDGGGGNRDGGGKGDMATGSCPGKNLQTDPMNCGACGHVCMGAHVAMNGCVGGKCTIGMCAMGYYDLDSMADDGCECAQSAGQSSATMQCAGAASLGMVTDEPASMVSATGNLVPMGDETWYQVQAVDTPEADGGCDKFHVKIAFDTNPMNQFLFDVFFDDCMSRPGCDMNEGPSGLTTYEWDANNDPGGGNECPCNNSVTAPNVHKCTDNSQTLRIRVYRASMAPLSCDSYKLTVTNGM